MNCFPIRFLRYMKNNARVLTESLKNHSSIRKDIMLEYKATK